MNQYRFPKDASCMQTSKANSANILPIVIRYGSYLARLLRNVQREENFLIHRLSIRCIKNMEREVIDLYFYVVS